MSTNIRNEEHTRKAIPKSQDTKRDFVWNAVGSLIYALASIVLAFAVIRLAGPDEGGIFGFGFSTLGQQMFIIAYFGIRPFHITDMKNQFSFGDYLGTREITSLLAVLAVFLFVSVQVLAGNYNFHKAVILLLLAGYKIIDGFADVYESELQRQGLLYRTGQSLAFRTTLSVVTLLAVIVCTHSLLLAAAAADVMQIIGTYFFAVRVLNTAAIKAVNCPETYRFPDANKENASGNPSSYTDIDDIGSTTNSVDRSFQLSHVKELLSSTGLLFLSVFVDFYIFSASKYAIDAQLSDAVSGYFNVLFMPTSFIYLIANFMIRPMLTKLADQYAAMDIKAFKETCVYMIKAVLVLGAVIMSGALIFGRLGLTIFEIILGASAAGVLTGELGTFILLILGGAFYALANVMYYILVTIRKQRFIFAGYVMTAVVAALSAGRMVHLKGMFGGALNYLFLMSLLVVIFAAFALIATRELENMVSKPDSET